MRHLFFFTVFFCAAFVHAAPAKITAKTPAVKSAPANAAQTNATQTSTAQTNAAQTNADKNGTEKINDAASSLTKLLSGINSLQANFLQQTTDAKGGVQAALSGKMHAKRPGMFRWEVIKPAPQIIISSGKVMWIFDPELDQATKQKLDAQVGNTPALLLSGDPRTLNDAFIISAEKNKTQQIYSLKPRGKDALFNTLRVVFNGNELTRMELADTLGQKTDIRFTELRVNPVLAATVFEFTPPKGVDVIDQF